MTHACPQSQDKEKSPKRKIFERSGVFAVYRPYELVLCHAVSDVGMAKCCRTATFSGNGAFTMVYD
jgi:hypothetical protein